MHKLDVYGKWADHGAKERGCMSWEKEVEELKRRHKLAEGMGGPEKLKRQKDGGKLNVRERIAGLVDKGSFREVGKLGGVGQYDAKGNLTSFLPANILFGRARIDGRPIVVQADDFTVRGGAADASLHGKLIQSEKLANEYRMPLVRLIEGTGGGGSVTSSTMMGSGWGADGGDQKLSQRKAAPNRPRCIRIATPTMTGKRADPPSGPEPGRRGRASSARSPWRISPARTWSAKASAYPLTRSTLETTLLARRWPMMALRCLRSRT